jgi:hypothetical protein
MTLMTLMTASRPDPAARWQGGLSISIRRNLVCRNTAVWMIDLAALLSMTDRGHGESGRRIPRV